MRLCEDKEHIEEVHLGKTNNVGGEGCPHKALGLGGVMQESGLQ